MASLRDKLASAVRLFARPVSFVAECPNCGKIHVCWARQRRGPAARNALIANGWDRRRGLFTCQFCRHRYLVGILLWPVGLPGHQPAIPKDHVPNPRQLVQLRAMGSWWMDQPQGAHPDVTNLTSDCTCAPGTSQTNAADPACPIHGEGGEPYNPPPIEFDPADDPDPEGDD